MQLDTRLRFETYVVGSSNRLAVAAARAVTDTPGQVYNPLFIYGGSGLGKTHLLSAIGNAVSQRRPELSVGLSSIEEFLEGLNAAVQAGMRDKFAQRYLSMDLLLLEDVQFVSGQREIQSELLRILETMQRSARQVVMTSDRPPSEIPDVEERLISRLTGGLMVDVGQPDYETRVAIVLARCEERGVRFRPGVVDALGQIEHRNVRELQGALHRLIAAQTLGGEQIEPEDVPRVLGASKQSRDAGQPQARISRELASLVSEVELALEKHLREPDEQTSEQGGATDAEPAASLPGPSLAFTRAGFAVGASNHLAVRAADAVVSAPGRRYNPLFVHGPSGVGKTHLVNAIGNGLLSTASGGGPVVCLPAQTFMDELIAALQQGNVEAWRGRYRRARALILDDVQFVANKERTQEELFHVFNAIHGAGGQLVFASDRPPGELTGLEDRLRSRFEGGLVVEMQVPDRELRAMLYERLLADAGASSDRELPDWLAARHVDSVREMIGLVNRLVSRAEAAGVPLTLMFARADLERAIPAPRVTPVVETVSPALAPLVDLEKTVWDWPDTTSRLIEDLR
jgi:chromosomal replication initiation ATPase DnaA